MHHFVLQYWQNYIFLSGKNPSFCQPPLHGTSAKYHMKEVQLQPNTIKPDNKRQGRADNRPREEKQTAEKNGQTTKGRRSKVREVGGLAVRSRIGLG